jgi:outer membrane beta-barrel protein
MLAMLVFTAGAAGTARADTPGQTLDDEVHSLELPAETPNHSEALENLAAVQDRYSPLAGRMELGLSIGRDFTGDSFLNTNQLELSFRYHLTNHWSLGISGAALSNAYTSSADTLYTQTGQVPDVAYTRFRTDLTVGYNLFYGKVRLGFTQNVYFDQYVALGGGLADQNSGNEPEGLVDVGFAVWLDKWGSLRFGIRDYVLNEQSVLNSGINNNITGYIGLGVLL